MAEAGKSKGRTLLNNRLVRISLKAVLGLAAVVMAVFGAVVVYNAFDADLGADAVAMLAPPPMGKIDDQNGYIAFLGLVAPKGHDQMDWGRKAATAFAAQAQLGFTRTPEWKEATRSHVKLPADRNKWCSPNCLAEAQRDGDVVAKRLADADNAELLARYRRVREAPEFSELYMGPLLASMPLAYPGLHVGAMLSHADGAARAGAGDLEALVAEIEKEVAFHRRLIGQGRTLTTVMVGETGLARDLLTISEMIRADGGQKYAAFGGRLRHLTRPQVSAKALEPGFRFLAHDAVSWARHWPKLLRESSGTPIPDAPMEFTSNWTMSLFMRPNETMNLVAAVMKAESAIANVPAERFEREKAAIQAAHEALLERPWYAEASNPVGKGVAEVVANHRFAAYAARMNDLQALERMVDLQMALALQWRVETAPIAEFVAGEGANRDPYTGKAFAFDPAQRLLSFEPHSKERWNEMKKLHGGKVAIAI